LGKLAFALLVGLLPAQSAFSYTIITDSNLFYSFFEKPLKVIEFTTLKDGTSLKNISQGLPLNTSYKAKPDCLVSGRTDDTSLTSLKGIAVHSSAFSDDWSFMVVNPRRPDTFCRAVIWFDQGISSGNFKITVIAASGRSRPFVLYTNKGFLGIVPDRPQETIFIFDDVSVLFSFETDFHKTSSTSDSEESFFATF